MSEAGLATTHDGSIRIPGVFASWVLHSTIGLATGFSATLLARSLIDGTGLAELVPRENVLLALVPGAFLGFFQWRVLRELQSGTAAWIPSTSVGLGLGQGILFLGVGFTLGAFAFGQFGLGIGGGSTDQAVLSMLGVGVFAIGSVTAGLVVGVCQAFWLRVQLMERALWLGVSGIGYGTALAILEGVTYLGRSIELGRSMAVAGLAGTVLLGALAGGAAGAIGGASTGLLIRKWFAGGPPGE